MSNPARPDVSLFLASSVHDMKNSISMLIGVLEKFLARTRPEDCEDYHEMSQMLYETQRVNGNLIQLLTLYKFGNDMYPFSPATEEISDFASSAVSYVRPLLISKKIGVEIDLEDNCYWEFDSDLVTGVIVHAMNNAAHYTRDAIYLIIRQIDGALEIRVEDNGDGFPQHMLDEGAAAMRGINFSTGSTGLGLYFSATVAKMHRSRKEEGSIRLENGGRLGGGCFVLRLP